MWSLSFYGPVAWPIAILSKHTSSIVQDTFNECSITPVCEIWAEIGRFCKRRFAEPNQIMDEKKLKNRNCIENGYKLSSSHSESFGFLPSFSKYLPDLQYTVPAFWPIFLWSFCEIQPQVCELNFSGFCEWPLHFRRTGLSGHTTRSETTKNYPGQDLGCILDAPSLQCRAILPTLVQDEPYADAHCRGGVSTIPQVLVVSA